MLLLSQPSAAAMSDVVKHGLTPTLYSPRAIGALASAAKRRNATVPVHVKVDTGMHRVGAEPEAAVELAVQIADTPGLTLEGFYTHLAVSEELGRTGVTEAALDRFDAAVEKLAARGVAPKSCTRRTRAARSAIRGRATTWCASASRSTATHRALTSSDASS